MIDMGQSGSFLSHFVGFHGPVAGSVLGIVGGLAYATDPASPAGTAGLYVGMGGILMGAATLLGVLGDKWGPHFIQYTRIRAEAQEEFRKNREARHRLANELQAAKLEMEALRQSAAEAKEKADRSEDHAVQVAAELAAIKKYARDKFRATDERLGAVESAAGSGDDIPAHAPSPRPSPPDRPIGTPP